MAEVDSNDLFDEVTTGDPSPTELDVLATGEETAPPPGEQAPAKPEITLEGLQADIAQLQRANSGLTHALTDERGKRQQHEGRLQGISDTFSKALEARQTQEIPPEPKEPEIPDKLAVDFSEDGSPFVRTEDILKLTKLKQDNKADLTKPQIEALDGKINQLATQMVQGQALQGQQKVLNSLISSNPTYPEAMSNLQGQWQFLNQMYDQYVSYNSLPVPSSIEEAMQQIVSSPVAQEFSKQFPGSDVELLIETFTTPSTSVMQRKLKKALDGVSKSNGTGQSNELITPKKNNNLSALAAKPASLGNVSNQARSADTTIERVADMGLDDFMALSDSDMNKVHSLLEAQENN